MIPEILVSDDFSDLNFKQIAQGVSELWLSSNKPKQGDYYFIYWVDCDPKATIAPRNKIDEKFVNFFLKTKA